MSAARNQSPLGRFWNRASKARAVLKDAKGVTGDVKGIADDVRGIADTFKDILGLFGGGAATVAVVGQVPFSGGGGFLSGLLQGVPFPIRLIVFVFATGALGWSLGVITSWLTRRPSDSKTLFGLAAAFGVGAVMISLAHWLAVDGPMTYATSGELLERTFLAAVGTGLVLALMTGRLHATPGAYSKRQMRSRSWIVLAFSLSAFGILGLLELSTGT